MVRAHHFKVAKLSAKCQCNVHSLSICISPTSHTAFQQATPPSPLNCDDHPLQISTQLSLGLSYAFSTSPHSAAKPLQCTKPRQHVNTSLPRVSSLYRPRAHRRGPRRRARPHRRRARRLLPVAFLGPLAPRTVLHSDHDDGAAAHRVRHASAAPQPLALRSPGTSAAPGLGQRRRRPAAHPARTRLRVRRVPRRAQPEPAAPRPRRQERLAAVQLPRRGAAAHARSRARRDEARGGPRQRRPCHQAERGRGRAAGARGELEDESRQGPRDGDCRRGAETADSGRAAESEQTARVKL